MNSPTRRRATLDAVAAAAGVSKATVSKVLNDRPGVAAETRARVQSAMQSLDYQPSTGPRAAQRASAVNVVFDTLINLYSTEVLNGVMAAARDADLEVVVDVLGRTPSREPGTPLSPAWIRAVARKGRVGVIVVTTELTSAQRSVFKEVGLDVVVIDPLNPTDQRVVSVASTNFNGGLQATNYLLDLGHRRIGFAGGPSESYSATERLQGFRSALEGRGATAEPGLVMRGAFTYESGIEMGLALLGRADRPTAVFAGCDVSALGVYEAARRLGLSIPGDVSVVGFDDTAAALWSAPPLTTVRQPITELGRVALRTLLDLAAGEPPVSHHIQLATRLVERESTAPLHEAVATSPAANATDDR